MKNEIIQALLDTLYSSTEYVSGELLSRRFGVSRAAVSKAIQSLIGAGWPIESVKHHGYRLSHLPDLLVEPILSDTLHRQGVRHFASSVQAWPSLDSTNLAARRGVEAGDPDGSLYVAEEQTAGRGRRGKTWRSASGEGLWFSLLLIPDFAPELMARITLFAGLCAASALRELTSLDVRLKWPNDLVVLPEGRKLGGILTEMMVEENHIAGVIVGIGINVSTPEFPLELTAIATSLELAIRAANSGKPGHPSEKSAPADPAKTRPTRIELLAAILKQFENRWSDYNRMIKPSRTADTRVSTDRVGSADILEPVWLDEYRAICATVGRPVLVTDARGDSREGLAVTVAPSGDLVVRWPDGSETLVSAGEVSVRGLLGYT